MNRFTILAAVFIASCAPVPQATRAQSPDSSLPPMRYFNQSAPIAPTRPNAEIANDFLDLAFMMESGREIPVLTRFEGTISVRVLGDAPATLAPDLRSLLERLRNEAGIDIFLTGAPEANITIQSIPRAALNNAVPQAACFVVPRVTNWDEFRRAQHTAQVDWTTLTRRVRATIFVPSDVAPQEIRDCLHEELAQALGPLNDLYRLPDSIFNDDNIHAVLTGFDMLILKAHYSPQLANGMRRAEVAQRLPAILAGLNPTGQRASQGPMRRTSRDWIDAIEIALSNGGSNSRRRLAAERAVAIAQNSGWTGSRAGFSQYAYGRLQIQNDPSAALQAFRSAAQQFRSTRETRLHEAHVAVQLAAFALSAADAEAVLSYTDMAIPIASQYENAALLATLLMFRAEALDLSGRVSEGAAVRLDSQSWARYGFGDDGQVNTRLNEVAALNPQSRR